MLRTIEKVNPDSKFYAHIGNITMQKEKKVIISIKENGRIASRLNLKIFIKINIGKTDISPKIPI